MTSPDIWKSSEAVAMSEKLCALYKHIAQDLCTQFPLLHWGSNGYGTFGEVRNKTEQGVHTFSVVHIGREFLSVREGVADLSLCVKAFQNPSDECPIYRVDLKEPITDELLADIRKWILLHMNVYKQRMQVQESVLQRFGLGIAQ